MIPATPLDKLRTWFRRDFLDFPLDHVEIRVDQPRVAEIRFELGDYLYTITLDDVTIASQKWAGNSNAVDTVDTENLELTYSRIILLDNETGSRACYDVKTLTAGC